MKSFNYTVLAVALLGLAGVAQAATSSGQSYDGTIVVDGSSGSGSTNHPGSAGQPAIGVNAFYNGTKVAFSGLKGMAATDALDSLSDTMYPMTLVHPSKFSSDATSSLLCLHDKVSRAL